MSNSRKINTIIINTIQSYNSYFIHIVIIQSGNTRRDSVL